MELDNLDFLFSNNDNILDSNDNILDSNDNILDSNDNILDSNTIQELDSSEINIDKTNLDENTKTIIIKDENRLKLDIFNKLLKPFNILLNSLDDLQGIEIDRDRLLDNNIKELYLQNIYNIKKLYNTSKLTALHSNCETKQKFPQINLLRQILKCNDFILKPKVISLGYNKTSGKKILKRSYVIKKNI